MILSIYRAVMNLGRPLASPILRRRVRHGKEDALRLDERRGVAARARPVTPRLIWIHAASVGESVSALPLINHILDDDPDAHVLLTTGTRTSAALMANRLPARALHQYVPIDRPAWIKRFLAHWRPCVGILIENEIWPNLIIESKAAGLPLVLVNGRLSARSFKRWRWIPGIARKLFGRFDLILAVDAVAEGQFTALGAPKVAVAESLKLASPPLPVAAGDLAALRGAVAGRPLWVAASTHAGEETPVLAAHGVAAAKTPDLLTIIVPRHPERGDAVAEEAAAAGRRVRRRAAGALPAADTEIYVADTLGEMAIFFALGEIVFIAGSLVPVGGHNPLEPCHFGCAVLFGPLMEKNAEIARQLIAAGAARQIADGAALGPAVAELLAEPARVAAMAAAARTEAGRHLSLIGEVHGRIMTVVEARGSQHARA